ncbi:MAG: biotin-dependent carboxyltransferase family protein [Bacteroidota bacterium]
MIRFHIKKSGLQTLVQDGGRAGYQASGVPLSGAMDWFSAKLANRILGLPEEHPVLEITLIGPQIEIEGDCQICITGANLSPKLSGEPIEMYKCIPIESGSVLSFGRPQKGCRAYLSVRGHWKNEEWLGSRSSMVSLEGNSFDFGVLKSNNVLDFAHMSSIAAKVFPIESLKPHESPFSIRVLAGPEFERFSRRNIADFFSQTFLLSNHSNRMGCRLESSLNNYHPKEELISSGIVPGTIQISNSGQPIILMAEAQTSGGYNRIANVIHADIPALAQAKPADQIRFELVQLEEAWKAEKELKSLLDLI